VDVPDQDALEDDGDEDDEEDGEEDGLVVEHRDGLGGCPDFGEPVELAHFDGCCLFLFYLLGILIGGVFGIVCI